MNKKAISTMIKNTKVLVITALFVTLPACTGYNGKWPSLTDELPKNSERSSKSYSPATDMTPIPDVKNDSLTEDQAFELFESLSIDKTTQAILVDIDALEKKAPSLNAEQLDIEWTKVQLNLSRYAQVTATLTDIIDVVNKAGNKHKEALIRMAKISVEKTIKQIQSRLNAIEPK